MARNVLEENALPALQQCISCIKVNEIEKAISEAQTIIEKCKNVIDTERDAHCYEYSDKALLLGIFFRGIQNFANLKQMTVSSDWIKNPDLIEQVWLEMWDCKERLEYTSSYINTTYLEWVFKDIYSLYQDFYHTFGHGLYVSVAFLVKRKMCNICGQDIRACEHIPGKIYLGMVCGGIPQGITSNHVLLTDHPNDPRCRIWPWNKKEKSIEGTTYDVSFLYFFRLDDFMDDTTNNQSN
jgi:hypothetical protein